MTPSLLVRVVVFVSVAFSIGSPAKCAGPPLTPQQIQDAIREGQRYKKATKVFNCLEQPNPTCDSNLQGKKVKFAGAMAADGISKVAIFYNDWQSVVAESALAKQRKAQLSPADVDSKGLLHVFVEIQARGGTATQVFQYNDCGKVVLKIGSRVVEPLENKTWSMQCRLSSMDAAVGGGHSKTWRTYGYYSPKTMLDFTFDVSPQDLQSPVNVILVEGDGKRLEREVDLAGILDSK